MSYNVRIQHRVRRKAPHSSRSGVGTCVRRRFFLLQPNVLERMQASEEWRSHSESDELTRRIYVLIILPCIYASHLHSRERLTNRTPFSVACVRMWKRVMSVRRPRDLGLISFFAEFLFPSSVFRRTADENEWHPNEPYPLPVEQKRK